MNTRETTQNETPELFPIESGQNNVLAFSSTLKELRKTVRPELVRKRAGRKDREGNVHMVEYVEWHTVADILDQYAPNWSHTVKDIRPIGDIITITVALTIDGITREGIGTGRALTETGIKKAEHDALKRAAVKFGIARELYKKEFESASDDEPAAKEEPKQFFDPIAKSLGDMITARQLGMIRGIGRAALIDVVAECSKTMQCTVEELSKSAASTFIDHLRRIQQTRPIPMRRAG